MVMPMNELLGSLVVLAGSVFLFSAGLGVLRMPDAYNRIQTGTKASTLGTIMVLIGLAIYHPAWIGKLLLLIFFVLLTNPVSSHALARASHRRHIRLAEQTVIDKLDEDEAGAMKKVKTEVVEGVE
jgi:multicomponent Na+:H+ antiporter subunit G